MDWDSRRNILFANDCNFYGEKADTLVRIWNLDGTPLSSRIPLGMGISVPLSALKVSPYSMTSATIVAGTQDGRLFRIENADYNIGGNTNPVSVVEIGSESFPAGNIACIEFGRNADQIMVIFSNYGVASVWETRDGGESWASKEQNLPDMPIRWGVYHPGNSSQVMLATETGLWTTSDFDKEEFSWEIIENFPNVRVDMLKVRNSDFAMIAATHGRGLWYGTKFPLATNPNPVKQELNLYPNPAHNQVNLQIPVEDADRNYSLTVYDLQGREIRNISDFITRGNNEGVLDISGFEEGQYLVVVKSDTNMFKGRLIKISY
jgi:hypothetical protein